MGHTTAKAFKSNVGRFGEAFCTDGPTLVGRAPLRPALRRRSGADASGGRSAAPLPERELILRDQRIKQAFVLNQKKYYLPKEQHPDPCKNEYYLHNLRIEVENEFDERAAYRTGSANTAMQDLLNRARGSSSAPSN